MQRKQIIQAIGGGGFAFLLLGCGEAQVEAARPSGASMATPAASHGAGQGQGEAPIVRDVRMNPSRPLAGVPIEALVEADDPDGDALRLTYTWRVNGRDVVTGARPSLSLPDLAKGDEVEVEVVASDGRNASEPRKARARVGNRPPMVAGVDLQPESPVRAGDVVKVSPLARDPDGDDLDYSYRWLVNGVERGRDRELRTEGLRSGDRLSVEVVADDGTDRSKPFMSPELQLGNTPPRITQLPDVQTDSGVFTYQFEAYDADGDRNLRFFLDQSPAGMAIDAITGELQWRPKASQAGVHPVEVGVTDSQGEGTTFLFEVTVATETPSTPPASRED